MKRVIFLAIAVVAAIACERPETEVTPGEGQLQFVFDNLTTNARTGGEENIDGIVLSIENENEKVYDVEELKLYKFGGSFVSDPISLKEGSYRLTKFLVISATDEVLYAAPREGSKYSHMVQDPLDISISIFKDEVTKVSPQVLSVADLAPGDFGYATFSLDIVDSFDFLIAAFAYQDSTANFELTSAQLAVRIADTLLTEFDLTPETNQIRLAEGAGSYYLAVTKDGYETYNETFTEKQLKRYFSDSGPLTVVLQKTDQKVAVIQPDSSAGKDAVIGSIVPNTNYGHLEDGHIYAM